ncbi:MAG: hypothetical protein HY254_13410 [Burkholderiales bacterium]|nr:hypothetical protein [Burkholderiales bacterium]
MVVDTKSDSSNTLKYAPILRFAGVPLRGKVEHENQMAFGVDSNFALDPQ